MIETSKRIYQGVGLLSLVLVLGGGCRSSLPNPPQVPPTVVVTTVAAGQLNDGPVVRYTGKLRPHRRVDLAFRVGGYVQSLLSVNDSHGTARPVQAGDRVQTGTVLARLQATDFQAQSNAASAGVQAARASVDQARAKLSQARAAQGQSGDAVAEAQAALQAALAERTQAAAGVGQTRAGVAEAQTAVALAQDSYSRTYDLYRNGSATRPQEEAAKAGLDSASARLRAAQEALSAAQGRVTEANANIRVAQARIRQAQSAAAAGSAASVEASRAVLAAQAQADQAKAIQAAQQVPVSQTVLRSPLTGIVLGRSVEIGSLVGPGSPAFSLADTRSLDVTFGLPQKETSRLRVGQTLGVLQGTTRLQGIVTEIAPSADETTGVFGVQVTVPNPDRALKIGLIVTLGFAPQGDAQGTLVVPVSALIQSHDQPTGSAVMVVIAKNGLYQVYRRDVELGSSDGNQVAVRGLTPGMQVVADAPGLLYDGEQVQITTSETGAR